MDPICVMRPENFRTAANSPLLHEQHTLESPTRTTKNKQKDKHHLMGISTMFTLCGALVLAFLCSFPIFCVSSSLFLLVLAFCPHLSNVSFSTFFQSYCSPLSQVFEHSLAIVYVWLHCLLVRFDFSHHNVSVCCLLFFCFFSRALISLTSLN